MDARQFLEWIDRRIEFLEKRMVMILGARGNGKSMQSFVENAILTGRLEELKDIRKMVEEELL